MISKLTPNKLRFIYDVLVSLCCAFFVKIYAYFFLAHSLFSFFVPLTLLALIYFLGIYGSNRFSSIEKKSSIIFTSNVLICLIVFLVLGYESIPEIILWFSLSSICLISPRVFIGFTNRANGFVRSIVNYSGPIVVTGGAGYIGSYVVSQLLSKGYSVRVLDSLMYGSESIAPFRSNPKFNLIAGDVTDISALTSALSGASAVIHLAGLVGDPACAVDDEFTQHTNIVATKLIKQVANSLGIYRFIFSSSCSVYGVNDSEVSESAALNPVSLYARTKIDSELELLTHVSDDFIVTVLRFATVFGHSKRPRFDLVANLFAAQAINDGEITVIGPNQWRPFIHVEDLAKAIVMTLEANPKDVQNQIFNVGDSRLNMTLMQLADIVQECAGIKGVKIRVNIQDGNVSDLRNYAVSFSKIKKILGFESDRTMDDGVGEIMDKVLSGEYSHYRDPIYSNLLTTKEFSEKFHDPQQRTNLYSTLGKL